MKNRPSYPCGKNKGFAKKCRKCRFRSSCRGARVLISEKREY